MASSSQMKRKYSRHKAPKSLHAAWRADGRTTVSRADVIGMGGVFLHTPNPLPVGAMLELVFELKTGDVRARASVRNTVPGKGMGVQFVQMQTEDRSRLSQLLAQFELSAGNASDASKPKPNVPSKTVAREPGKAASAQRRRSVRRCALVASAEVIDSQSGARLSARISEIAMGGCYVDALNPFPEGTSVKLRVVRDRGVFEAEAQVVYCHAASGMGLTFTRIAPRQRSLLEDWLAEIITNGDAPQPVRS